MQVRYLPLLFCAKWQTFEIGASALCRLGSFSKEITAATGIFAGIAKGTDHSDPQRVVELRGRGKRVGQKEKEPEGSRDPA